MSWTVEGVVAGDDRALRLQATHREHDYDFPVELILARSARGTPVFQERDAGYCWQFELQRCPA